MPGLTPWDNVICLSRARCLFKPPHWCEDCGLRVGTGICKLESSSECMHAWLPCQGKRQHRDAFQGRDRAAQGVAAQESPRAPDARRRQPARPDPPGVYIQSGLGLDAGATSHRGIPLSPTKTSSRSSGGVMSQSQHLLLKCSFKGI